ncbi:MAG: conjugal transfer protein TraF [Oscillospiraceae bacterium]|nr:conjugal transfer protein TraF [Oscillospiraceae bacterium]
MKKKVLTALILLALFTVGFLLGVFVVAPLFNRTTETPRVPTADMLRFQAEYEALNGTQNAAGTRTMKTIDIPEFNLISYITPEEILDIADNGTGLIFFSFPQCPWCRQMAPLLIDVALDMGLDVIHHIDMTTIRTTWELQDGVPVMTNPGHPYYQDLLVAFERVIEPLPLNPFHLVDEDGERHNTEELRIFVPTVVAIRDGRIVDWHVYTSERSFPGNEGNYQWDALDADETAELREIYQRVIGAMIVTPDCGDNSLGC